MSSFFEMNYMLSSSEVPSAVGVCLRRNNLRDFVAAKQRARDAYKSDGTKIFFCFNNDQ